MIGKIKGYHYVMYGNMKEISHLISLSSFWGTV